MLLENFNHQIIGLDSPELTPPFEERDSQDLVGSNHLCKTFSVSFLFVFKYFFGHMVFNIFSFTFLSSKTRAYLGLE